MYARIEPARVAAPALLLLVCVVYANALGASFQFDDFQMIVDNPRVHGLDAWWASLPGIRPLLKLSYALNWTLSAAPRGWHAFNLGVHVLNTWLVLVLARRWQRDLWPAPAYDSRIVPWAAAALFALHPATTEAVTYLSGRSISLMATFYLAAFIAHRRAEESDRATAWRALAAGLFALALGVRETAVTLPVALLLYACFRGQRWRDALAGLRMQGVVLLLGLVASALTPGYRAFFGWSLLTRGLGPQLAGQLQAHGYLAGQALLALPSNIDPDVRVPDRLDLPSLMVALVLLALPWIAWRTRLRAPWLGFGLLWYLLQLAPSNSLLPRFDLANDRHLYLALPGLALVVAGALAALRPRALAVIVLTAMLALLAIGTHRRNDDYRSELALWQATVRVSPHKARPWLNLGYARQQVGDRDGAIAAYRCALERDPAYAQAAINLGALGGGEGDDVSPGRSDPCAIVDEAR